MSLELVLLVPVLVLLTLFVLWAGRGGRAGLSADLAAEEAATAAALCCDEGDDLGREALVEDVLEARPGLEFLCVGGLRPEAGPAGDEFVDEDWLDFEPGPDVRTGGLGILGVRFACETDGAVAPLRGLFPTVTFRGQASEIVLQDPPRPGIGFEQTRFTGTEGAGLVFMVTSGTPVIGDVTVAYSVDPGSTATAVTDYGTLSGTVTILDGQRDAQITVTLPNDNLYEDTETLILTLDPASVNPPGVAQVDTTRVTATGVITDDDPAPHVWVRVHPADASGVREGGIVRFEVRLRDEHGNQSAPSSGQVTVVASTMDSGSGTGFAVAGTDYTAVVGETVTFNQGEVDGKTVLVQTLDDGVLGRPLEAEPDEIFKLVLSGPTGLARLSATPEATGTILDDETTLSISDTDAVEGDDLVFTLGLTPAPIADVTVQYRLVAHTLTPVDRQAIPESACTTAGADYQTPATPDPDGWVDVTIPYGRISFDLSAVVTCDDDVVEPDEAFWLELRVPSGVEAIPPNPAGAVGTIRNDDIPVFSIDPVDTSGTEGQASPLAFEVSLTVGGHPAQLSQDVTVDYDFVAAPGADAAAPGTDFEAVAPAVLSGGTLTFPAGGTVAPQTVAVVLLADYELENDETFRLVLSNPSGSAVLFDRDTTNSEPDEPYAVGTIIEDPPPVLTVTDFVGREGSQQRFIVRVDGPRAGERVTVQYDIVGAGANPATPITDFEAVAPAVLSNGTLDFRAPLITARAVDVTLLHDTADELDETLRLVLKNPQRAVLFDRDTTNSDPDEPYGVGTIENVDAPSLTVDNAWAREGEDLVFTISVDHARQGETVTVGYDVQERSAEDGLDYTAADPLTGTLDLGDTDNDPVTAIIASAEVRVRTLSDIIVERDEDLWLVIDNQSPPAVAVTVDKAVGVGTITNVNPATLRVTDPRAQEGTALTFDITLQDDNGNPAQIVTPVIVNYLTADRTAEDGVPEPPRPGHPPDSENAGDRDYTPVSGSHTFQPGGSMTHPVTVSTETDIRDEDDEIFALVLSTPSPAALGDAEGTGTIIDADPPALRIENADAQEGDTMTFQVLLGVRDTHGNFVETPTSEAVTVFAATEDGTATAPADYTAVSRQPLTIPAGQTRVRVPLTVATTSDDINEPPETFRVLLNNASNARIDRAIAIGTINPRCVNINTDDADNQPPGITVHDTSFVEGHGYSPEISLNRPLCQNFALTVRRFSGTAILQTDYTTGYVEDQESTWTYDADASRFPRMELYQYVPLNDDLYEGDEWFEVGVKWASTMPSHYTGPTNDWRRIRVTIIDNDDPPRLSVADASADEGDAISFDITLEPAPHGSGLPATVEYRTVPASGTAEEGVDYTAVGWTTEMFTPGETAKTFTVATIDDGPGDGGETFQVELRAPTNAHAVITDSVAVGTILEGNLPEMRIGDARGDEGGAMQFQVTLSKAATTPVTASFATLESPDSVFAADETDDYTARSGTVSFDAGDTVDTISVPIIADDVDEVDETFLVELTNPNGASLADPSAVGTINGNIACVGRDDAGPTMTPSSPGANEGDGRITFTVTFDPPLCERSALSVTGDAGGTARPGEDYVTRWTAQGFYVNALETQTSFSTALIDDDIDEPDEQIRLWILLWLTRSRAVAEGTIFDDDQASLSVTGDSGPEGGVLNFVIGLDGPSSRDVTVRYATEDSSPASAEAGEDYRARSGIARIPAGELSAAVAVRTFQDLLDEHDETFRLRLTNPTGDAELDPDATVATGTITDDDDPPEVGVSDPSVDEGGTLVFEVRLDRLSGRAASVVYSTRDGSATAGSDYEAASGTLDFAAGETLKTLDVTTLGDDEVESPEHLWVDLSSPSHLSIDDGLGRGTIRDISPRRVTVSDASVTEGGELRFAVGFTGAPSGRDITLRYVTEAGTATAGDDYSGAFESTPAELRIVAGETSAAAVVPTVQDSLDEDAEQLTLRLSDPVGAVLVNREASGVIIDDDPLPAMSISDAEATENEDGTPITFTLSLSEPSGRDVTVLVGTSDGTAEAGSDYTALTNQTVTIAPGHRSLPVPVSLLNDDVTEDVEQFLIGLSSPTNAALDDAAGVGRILDDDGLVQILMDTPAPAREDVDAQVVFTVRLGRASTDEVTVNYATENATATAGDDYTHTSAPLTFTAGDLSKTVTVALIDDDEAEETETFRLRLSGPSSNAELGDETATAVIHDDDGLPALSVADAAATTEGGTASFTVSLNRPAEQAATFSYAAVADPTAGDAAATPGQDFEAVTGTVTIAARGRSATVTVPLRDDDLDEATETFWLRLSNPNGADIRDGTATGAITDDDPLPELSIADAGASEGDPLRFEVRLDTASGRNVAVPWTTAVRSSTDDAAAPVEDFVAASGTARFAPGATTATVVVATVEDDVSEPDETLLVQLGEPTNAAVDDGAAVGTIRDDDGLPRVSVFDTAVDEDDGPAKFAATLSHRSSLPVTVAWATSDGTADAGDDYGTELGVTGTIVFPAGLLDSEVSVFVADDDIAEDTETFHITLSDPQNAVIAADGGTATAYILDDEQARLSVEGAQASEGDGTITFTATLSHEATGDVTVRYATFDGSATQPDDYTAVADTLTISAGDTAGTIAVPLTDDVFTEEAETFLLRLSGASGAELVGDEAIGVILDDDDLPTLTLDTFLRVEEDAGSVSIRVTLSQPSDVEVRVNYRTFGNNPSRCPRPYVPASDTLVFAPGSVAETIEITIVDDPNQCAGYAHYREFWVQLSNPRNAQLTHLDTSNVQVWDHQTPPCVDWDSGTRALEASGSLVFMVGTNYAGHGGVTITFSTRDRSARAGTDYTALSNHTVTVPDGTRRVPVAVTIIDDSDVEPDELLELVATSAPGAELRCFNWPNYRGGWIIDDDELPVLSVEDLEASEDAGTAIFIAAIERVSADDVTANYQTADETATAGDDYTHTSGTLTIKAGTTSTIVEVPLIDDDETELDETFTLSLDTAVGATLASSGATATILDDDREGLPVIEMTDASVVEDSTVLDFTATLSRVSTQPVSFTYTTVEVPSLGDRAATPVSDYSSWTRTVTIPAGRTATTEGQVRVWLSPRDTIPERDESFLLVLSDPVNATLGTTQVWGTILNNDQPLVTVADETASESNDSVVFTLRLHASGVDNASVRYTTAVRASAVDPATPGEDYTHTSGKLDIPAGDTTATITVPIIGDSADEPDETFLLELSDPDLLELSDSAAVGTITDDDPGYWIDDRSVRENTATMTFTVKRDHTSAEAVTVNYRIAPDAGSAEGGDACTTEGVDFETPSGTVTLQPTDTEAEIMLTLCNDAIAEGSETLLIELTNVTGRKTTGVGTIVDDDTS